MDESLGMPEEHRPLACALGIGENGPLAFNDPPADFTTIETMIAGM
jgi:hypothetical protein